MVYAFDPFPGEDAPQADFGLAVHPLSLHLAPGGQGGVLVRTWTGKAGLPLTLAVERVPADLLARFTPDRISAGEESKLVVSVADAVPGRTYALTVVGTGPDGRYARAYLSVTVG